jgi:hypothetical protein
VYLLEFIRYFMASCSYILHLISVSKNEVSFNYTSWICSPFIKMLYLVIFVFRYVVITVYCYIATIEANRIQDSVQCFLLCQNVRNEVVEQLKLFSSQLTVCKIEFKALEFFSLNLNDLSAFQFSVVMYIIVFELLKN